MNSATMFHAGELRAQALAGGGPPGAAIRDFMPEQHRAFFGALRFLLLATLDAEGAPAATVLHGAPGFIGSPDARCLRIAGTAIGAGADAPQLQAGQPVGLLGIDFAARRRNRANGVVAAVDEALTVMVHESFGNCPKYIQPCELVEVPAVAAQPVQEFEGLDAEARRQIAGADTLFVATWGGPGTRPDISHRGGPAGFVGLDGDTLAIPDFRGNRYFNTFGNLLLQPRAALLLIDFSSGGVLQLQGSAEIDWEDRPSVEHVAAERLWRFRVERGWRSPQALPLRWFRPS